MSSLIILGGRVEIKDVRAFIARLAEIGKEQRVTIQAANADLIAGREHLEYAVTKAIEAFHNKTNLARDLGMEIMLYLRGRRQIEKALEMGVHPGVNNVAIAIVGDGAEGARDSVLSLLDEADDGVVEYDHKKDEALMRLYDITPAELEIVGRDRIPLLARERSALLEFEK